MLSFNLYFSDSQHLYFSVRKDIVQILTPFLSSPIPSALKESGYESDSTLVFKKREDARRLAPDPRKTSQVYRQVRLILLSRILLLHYHHLKHVL